MFFSLDECYKIKCEIKGGILAKIYTPLVIEVSH